MPTRHIHPTVQYLGRAGTTMPCVQAMATILMSPFPCQEITVVFSERHSGADHYAALFVIWDWLDHEITIVPDGFGTHNGTGGWGLAVVLDLITFYKIPLREKLVPIKQFQRIAFGHLTERDRTDLHQPDVQAPSWPYYRRNLGPSIWHHLFTESNQPFPHWCIEPELQEDVRDIAHDPDGAVFRAVRRLEVLVREMGGYDDHLTGQDLINKAMGEQGQLLPDGATSSERTSWAHLFRGAIGAFKNPQSHRDVKLSLTDATGQVLAVNLLIRKLKQDFPDRFPKMEQSTNFLDDGDDDEDGSDLEFGEELSHDDPDS